MVRRSPRWVKGGGWLLVEVGGDQVAEVTAMFIESGYGDVDVLEDADGDPRGMCGRLRPVPCTVSPDLPRRPDDGECPLNR